jgi:hypothetical protein
VLKLERQQPTLPCESEDMGYGRRCHALRELVVAQHEDRPRHCCAKRKVQETLQPKVLYFFRKKLEDLCKSLKAAGGKAVAPKTVCYLFLKTFQVLRKVKGRGPITGEEPN